MRLLRKSSYVALASMLSIAAYAGDGLPGDVLDSERTSSVSGIQQQQIVTGQVVDSDTGEPLIGVNVLVQGTTNGTATDIDGYYSIQAPGDAVLVFSYIGYEKLEIPVNGRRSFNVSMRSDATMLGEVVVYTGYMSQRKADLTGSVSMAATKDIKKTSANVMKNLQGKMAGVKISVNGGNPAESVGIQIRGLSSLSGAVSPLIVLDGMPTEDLNLRDINSGDIESIQVLKDAASASIYGARASGGVILIQTKKGKAGKTTVDYNGSVSVSSVVKRPDMMDTYEWGTAAFRAAAYDNWAFGDAMLLPNGYDYEYHRGDNGMYVLDNMTVRPYLDADQLVPSANTDWLDEIFRTAISTNHQLTISSGTEKSKSLFSFGYTNNQGTQLNSYFKQYSARVNTEYNLFNDRVTVGENLAVSYLQYKDQYQTWVALQMPPIVPVYDVNGNWAGPAGFDDIANPVRLLSMGKDNYNNFVKVIGNVFVDLDIWNGISARSQFGINYGNGYNRWIDDSYVETGFRTEPDNYVRQTQNHNLSYVWTNTLSYNKSFGNHHIDAVFGTEFTRFRSENFNARRNDVYMVDPDYAFISTATGEKITLGAGADEYAYFSIFAKANYSYAGKYLLSATVRRDGSSLFGANNRYGVFPAFSAGWRIKDEAFMENTEDWLSDLKLRVSWGANGSVQGLPRGYTTTPFTAKYEDTAYPIKGNENGSLESGYRRSWLGNPDLKWETTTQTTVGVDFGFMNQRLTGSFDYYNKRTKDILVQTPYIAAMGEGGEPWINGASMKNNGVEFTIAFRSDPVKEFQWSITANIGTYKTILIDLPDNVINKYSGDGVHDLILGRSPNAFYGLVADGIFRTQEEVDAHADQPGKAVGRIRYKDLDGDGVINETYDRTWIGCSDPDFFGGITFDFAYKGFDLNVFFDGVFGNDVHNCWRQERDVWLFTNPAWKNHPSAMLDAWMPDNPGSDIPAITNNKTNNEQRFSSQFIENGSFIKLRNMELGYTFPDKIAKKMYMSNLRVYVSGENLLTMKKTWGKDAFTSIDPEDRDYGYLRPITVNFGINATF